MSNANVTVDRLGRGRPRGKQPRRRIDLPDGDYLEPRAKFAAETLGVSDRTAARLKLPTTYVGNVAYIARGASMLLVAAGVRRPGLPEPTSAKQQKKRRR